MCTFRGRRDGHVVAWAHDPLTSRARGQARNRLGMRRFGCRNMITVATRHKWRAHRGTITTEESSHRSARGVATGVPPPRVRDHPWPPCARAARPLGRHRPGREQRGRRGATTEQHGHPGATATSTGDAVIRAAVTRVCSTDARARAGAMLEGHSGQIHMDISGRREDKDEGHYSHFIFRSTCEVVLSNRSLKTALA